MINFIIRIILLISLAFNIALYYGWMDIGQYRNYVDKSIEDLKEIANSDEVKNLGNLIGDKLKENTDELQSNLDLEQVAKDLQKNIIEVGVNQAKENLEKEYKDLTQAQIDEIVKAARETLEK